MNSAFHSTTTDTINDLTWNVDDDGEEPNYIPFGRGRNALTSKLWILLIGDTNDLNVMQNWILQQFKVQFKQSPLHVAKANSIKQVINVTKKLHFDFIIFFVRMNEGTLSQLGYEFTLLDPAFFNAGRILLVHVEKNSFSGQDLFTFKAFADDYCLPLMFTYITTIKENMDVNKELAKRIVVIIDETVGLKSGMPNPHFMSVSLPCFKNKSDSDYDFSKFIFNETIMGI